MNLSQFKQLVQNNLWHGEQQRQRLSRELVVVPSFVSVDMSRVWGCDISHWQGLVNLLVAKNNGCSFVIIKACDGSLNTNYFIENRNKAKEVGLLWGAYVWLYPNNRVSIAAQVAAWWARLKDDYPPLGVWIDTEWTTYAGQTANPSAADLKSALDQFRALSGQAGVYTAAGYANQYLIGFDWSSADLWVANYNVVNPQLPSGATKYKFHQFTSNLDGVNLIGTTPDSKEVDGDYYNGTREKFAAEYGGATEPPPTGEKMKYTLKNTNTGTLSIRSAPLVIADRLDTIASGVTVDGDFVMTHKADVYTYDTSQAKNILRAKAGDKWMHLSDNRGWSAVVHLGATQALLTAIPDDGTGSSDNSDVLTALAALKEEVNLIIPNIALIKGDTEEILDIVSASAPTDPGIPPVSNDGYTGLDMGVYRVMDRPDDPEQQTGNTITTIQDSYGNEQTVIMDAMVAWMVANCPGWDDFVKNGSVVQGADGLWRYEVKVIKGQLLRIAEVGGKTSKNPLGNGRIVGMDSEGDPTHGAVNMAAVSPTLTPHYFHKIPSVPRYFPIVQPRQQKQMTVLNAWWIPMRWLEKV